MASGSGPRAVVTPPLGGESKRLGQAITHSMGEAERVLVIEQAYEKERSLSMSATPGSPDSERDGGGSADATPKSSPVGASRGSPDLLHRLGVHTRTATSAVAAARSQLDREEASLWHTVALLRTQVWTLLEYPRSSSLAGYIATLMAAAILASSACFCLETVSHLATDERNQYIFACVEAVCIAVFTTDYLLRLVSCPALGPFLLSFLNAVDAASVVPFYVKLALGKDGSETRIMRILRLVRVLRIFKLGKHFERAQIVVQALINSTDMLLLLTFLILICMVIFSTLIYYCERGEYLQQYGFSSRVPWDVNCRAPTQGPPGPSVCTPLPSPYNSIPSSFWWCIVTLMTVGYGDVVPVTPWGKVVAALTMLTSVLLISLPVSVIGAEFTNLWLEFKSRRQGSVERRRRAPRFMQLRDALAAHSSLLDDILLRTRDVLFDMDDLRVRLIDKQRRHLAELEAHRRVHRGHRAAQAGAAILEAAMRDVRFETEMLLMELDMQKTLVRLQELLTQAETLRQGPFLLTLERCRGTYVTLKQLAASVASLTEEADDTEEALEETLAAELRGRQVQLRAASAMPRVSGSGASGKANSGLMDKLRPAVLRGSSSPRPSSRSSSQAWARVPSLRLSGSVTEGTRISSPMGDVESGEATPARASNAPIV